MQRILKYAKITSLVGIQVTFGLKKRKPKLFIISLLR